MRRAFGWRGLVCAAAWAGLVNIAGVASASPYLLSNSPGDGSVDVNVDGYGSFGVSIGANASDAIYDPIGPGTPAGTTFESGLAIRFGDTGSRQFLTSGLIGSSGALPNPTVSGSATSGTSAFSFGGLDFVLSQVLSPRFDVSANRIGSRLTQTYTINNPGASTASFELIRYLDGDLEFDNMISDGGGRFLVNGVETLFETDTAQNVADPTTFVGISAPDGNAPAVGRYQISVFTGSSGGMPNLIIDGVQLDNTVHGDGPDADEFIDAGSGYDVTLSLRRTFDIPTGQTATYTAVTDWGSGVVPEPTSLAGAAVLLAIGAMARRRRKHLRVHQP